MRAPTNQKEIIMTWTTLGKIALSILAKNNSPAFQRISGLANNYNTAKSIWKGE